MGGGGGEGQRRSEEGTNCVSRKFAKALAQPGFKAIKPSQAMKERTLISKKSQVSRFIEDTIWGGDCRQKENMEKKLPTGPLNQKHRQHAARWRYRGSKLS